jgi:hypothetical protein
MESELAWAARCAAFFNFNAGATGKADGSAEHNEFRRAD